MSVPVTLAMSFSWAFWPDLAGVNAEGGTTIAQRTEAFAVARSESELRFFFAVPSFTGAGVECWTWAGSLVCANNIGSCHS